jgi:hypothetical protein
MRAWGNFGRNFRAAFAAGGADEIRLDVGQPDMIGPAVGADRDMVAALVVPAIDQNIADTGCAQFAERDFLRVGRHGGPSSLSRAGTLAPFAGSVNRAWTARRIREPRVTDALFFRVRAVG